jgi:hypothetical protein
VGSIKTDVAKKLIGASGSHLSPSCHSTVRKGNDRAHDELCRDQDVLLTMEDKARWLIQNRLTDRTRVPNYHDYLYPEALRQVNPKAVRMIIPAKGSLK